MLCGDEVRLREIFEQQMPGARFGELRDLEVVRHQSFRQGRSDLLVKRKLAPICVGWTAGAVEVTLLEDDRGWRVCRRPLIAQTHSKSVGAQFPYPTHHFNIASAARTECSILSQHLCEMLSRGCFRYGWSGHLGAWAGSWSDDDILGGPGPQRVDTSRPPQRGLCLLFRLNTQKGSSRVQPGLAISTLALYTNNEPGIALSSPKATSRSDYANHCLRIGSGGDDRCDGGCIVIELPEKREACRSAESGRE